ncbi:hypothetical protein ACQY0O_007434 [Thecaphora frezii]
MALTSGSELSDLSDAPPPTPGRPQTPAASPGSLAIAAANTAGRSGSRRTSDQYLAPSTATRSSTSASEASLSSAPVPEARKSQRERRPSSKLRQDDVADPAPARPKITKAKPRTAAKPEANEEPEPRSQPKPSIKIKISRNKPSRSQSAEGEDLAGDADAATSAAVGSSAREDARVASAVAAERDEGSRRKPSVPTLVSDGDEDEEDKPIAGATRRKSGGKRSRVATSHSGSSKRKKARLTLSDDEDDDNRGKGRASASEDAASDAAMDEVGASSDDDGGGGASVQDEYDDEEEEDAYAASGRKSKSKRGAAATSATTAKSKAAAAVATKKASAAPASRTITPARNAYVKKGLTPSSKATPTTSAADKALNADKLRASIDSARDKASSSSAVCSSSAKAGPSKLNPHAANFTPKAGGGGASSSTSASLGHASSGRKPINKAGEVQFGKTMTGWDQLFGSLSGVSASPSSSSHAGANAGTASSSSNNTPSSKGKPKAAQPAQARGGIRPMPELENATQQQLAEMRRTQQRRNLNVDGCWDLLAHAEIMSAFEHDTATDDRKLASALRPVRFRAGWGLVKKR